MNIATRHGEHNEFFKRVLTTIDFAEQFMFLVVFVLHYVVFAVVRRVLCDQGSRPNVKLTIH
jgi:hypothetical protein